MGSLLGAWAVFPHIIVVFYGVDAVLDFIRSHEFSIVELIYLMFWYWQLWCFLQYLKHFIRFVWGISWSLSINSRALHWFFKTSFPLKFTHLFLKGKFVISKSFEVGADKSILPLQVVKSRFSWVKGSFTFSQFLFIDLIGFLKLSVLIFKIFDDHEQFFYLSFVVADEFEVFVYLPAKWGNIVASSFNCQEFLEMIESWLIEIASILVSASDGFDIVNNQFLDSEIIAMPLNIFL